MPHSSSPNRIAARIDVFGTVQGVGYRPFVYRLAVRHGLSGFVLNHDRGVTAEAEGSRHDVEAFAKALQAEAPAAARVERVVVTEIQPQGFRGFEIRQSLEGSSSRYVPIPPDLALCSDCRREVLDPSNRRYFYPFTNCTNCGPRLTITQSVPYDRPATTMAEFKMCAECQREYDDPADRRFHAQPNACPKCGPRVELRDANGDLIGAVNADARQVILAAANAFREGKILALKGIGGFHLACDARSEAAVSLLRARKLREKKALAVMFPGLESARQHAIISEAEASQLTSAAAPIVLVDRRSESDIAPSVAPGNRFLGVLLPYSPLHELLAVAFGGPLVMTSGNLSDEPIAFSDADALSRLGSIADLFLVHNRAIHIRCDDSVLRLFRGKTYFYRRSRGVSPETIRLHEPASVPVLAVGAQLKNTICFTRGEDAILSHHIGDLENLATLESFELAVRHYGDLFNVEPVVIAHDQHPDYLNTKWVAERHGKAQALGRVIGVQHHHAHIAACLGDNGYAGKVIGLALDGTGYGPDGTIWGGEALIADLEGFKRVGRLLPAFVAGGEAAIRQPWRLALAYLKEAGVDLATVSALPAFRNIDSKVAGLVWKVLDRRTEGYTTSSCGRLFDAVSAVSGVVTEAKYEGQAAIELENVLQYGGHQLDLVAPGYPVPLLKPNSGSEALFELDWRPLMRDLARDLGQGVTPAQVSYRFHQGLIEGLVALSKELSLLYDLKTIALSGGCFLNEFLLKRLTERLEGDGFRVLVHERVPTNDGGIAFGQALVAGAVFSKGAG